LLACQLVAAEVDPVRRADFLRRAANIEATGGKVRTEGRELVVRGRYRQYRAEELRTIVVKADPDGRQVRLNEIAEVVDRWAEDDPTRSWFNGRPSVIVTVNNLNVGRSPEETLRILDALQTGEKCACNRAVGGETL
jgi:multidrug efflux pump subunit AcrB